MMMALERKTSARERKNIPVVVHEVKVDKIDFFVFHWFVTPGVGLQTNCETSGNE